MAGKLGGRAPEPGLKYPYRQRLGSYPVVIRNKLRYTKHADSFFSQAYLQLSKGECVRLSHKASSAA